MHIIWTTTAVLDRAVDSLDAVMLASLKRAGRVQLVEGDDQVIMPGIRVYTGGKHTHASQFATVQTPDGTIVASQKVLRQYRHHRGA